MVTLRGGTKDCCDTRHHESYKRGQQRADRLSSKTFLVLNTVVHEKSDKISSLKN